jgi:hypothetical protein
MDMPEYRHLRLAGGCKDLFWPLEKVADEWIFARGFRRASPFEMNWNSNALNYEILAKLRFSLARTIQLPWRENEVNTHSYAERCIYKGSLGN